MTYKNILAGENKTPVTEPIPGKTMVVNNTGGYVFQITPLERLKRFLVLGSDGATYYQTAKDLTTQNIGAVTTMLQQDMKLVVDTIADYSSNNRCMRNDACVLALAVAFASGTEARQYILKSNAYNRTLRYTTDHNQFQEFYKLLGGKYNATHKRGINQWYNQFDLRSLEVQITKYGNREGWSHSDMLRVGHPTFDTEAKNLVAEYAMRGYTSKVVESAELYLIHGKEKIQAAETSKEVIRLINEYKMTWEYVPNKWLGEKDVWNALLPNLPPTALLRNLGRMTACGLLTSNGDATKRTHDKLEEYIANPKVRLHPGSMLLAWHSYKSGKSPNLFWNPVRQVVDLLEQGFYDRFTKIEPTGKRFLYALDCSGSMTMSIMNLPFSSSVAASALAVQFVRTEKWVQTFAFAHNFREFNIGKFDNLETSWKKASAAAFGSTDISLPMLYALENKIPVDMFVIVTDNELNTGKMHPIQALDKYQQKMSIAAKVAVIATTSTGFSVADPQRKDMMDFVGFDSQVPELTQRFAGNPF